MTRSLSQLATAEAQLLARLPLRRDDGSECTYADYEDIAGEYAELAAKGDSEALKRLVFLWWYSVSEPSFLSGLREFGSALSRATSRLLSRALDQGVNEEFRRMLTWYYSVTDWHFDEWVPTMGPMFRDGLRANRLRDGSTDLGVIDLESDRGALGRYFQSMREAQLKKR